MPKVLPDARQRFLDAARKILTEEGYQAFSLRRLSTQCQTALGTVYHYYTSKNDLIAAVMMEDWQAICSRLQKAAETAASFSAGMLDMYRGISSFSRQNSAIWRQYLASGGSGNVVFTHHLQLRHQISGLLSTLLSRTGGESNQPACPLLAEMLISAAVQTDIDEDSLLLIAKKLE